jgi:membrane protease YdiL (CAAX protease family)
MKPSSVLPRRDLLEALIITIGLLAYSNGLAIYAQRHGQFPERLFRRLNPFLIILMCVYAASAPGGLPAMGLHRMGLGWTLVGGMGLGLALSVPPLFFFYRPILLDTPLEYGPISNLTRRELLLELFIRLPIGVAVLEELAFRGLLYAAVRRQLSPALAIGINAAAFAGWHFAVTATSAAQSNLAGAARLPGPLRPYIQPLAVLGGMLSTGIAGSLFALLRERTGNLTGPILAHWIVDALMVAALWRGRPRQTR